MHLSQTKMSDDNAHPYVFMIFSDKSFKDTLSIGDRPNLPLPGKFLFAIRYTLLNQDPCRTMDAFNITTIMQKVYSVNIFIPRGGFARARAILLKPCAIIRYLQPALSIPSDRRYIFLILCRKSDSPRIPPENRLAKTHHSGEP